MKSGLDAEFVAVPGTDDVAFGFVILLRPRGLVARDRLEHAFHDAALADRAGAMRASVMPGVEFAADLEDADFRISAHDHLAIAVGIVVDLASHILGHPASSQFSLPPRVRKRQPPSSLRKGFATGWIGIGIRVRSSATPDRTANTIFGWSDTRRVSRGPVAPAQAFVMPGLRDAPSQTPAFGSAEPSRSPSPGTHRQSGYSAALYRTRFFRGTRPGSAQP